MANYTGRQKYTDEQINKALDLYQNSDKSISEIAEETGMIPTSISKYVKKYNLPQRQPHRGRDPYSRVCQFCRKKIALVEIRFCPYCGKDIREREDILKFDAKRLYQYQQHLPTVDRGTYKDIVDRIVAYFNDKTKKNLV